MSMLQAAIGHVIINILLSCCLVTRTRLASVQMDTVEGYVNGLLGYRQQLSYIRWTLTHAA